MKKPHNYLMQMPSQITLYPFRNLTSKQSLVLYTLWKLQIVNKIDRITRSLLAINCRLKKNYISQILHELQGIPLKDTYIICRKCFLKEDTTIHYNAYSLNLNTFVTSGITATILLLLKFFPTKDMHICKQEFKNHLLSYEIFSSMEDADRLLEFKLEWATRSHISYIYLNKNLEAYIFPHERISLEINYLKYIANYYLDHIVKTSDEEKKKIKSILNKP